MVEEHIGQRSLLPTSEFSEVLHNSTELKVGDGALAVFREVLRLNPKISAVTITFYPVLEDSDDDESLLAQHSVWLPVKFALEDNTLSEISQLNFNICISDEYESRIMAIVSQVGLLNGEMAHIPMMDLSSEGCLTAEEVTAKFVQTPGVVLDSGNSYHFWGFNLLTEREFESFMMNRLEMENKRAGLNERPIYEKRFIEASIRRGFSALRIFGYPNTPKKEKPRVVAIIK